MATPSTLALKEAIIAFNIGAFYGDPDEAQRNCVNGQVICLLTKEGRAESLEHGQKRDNAFLGKYGKAEEYFLLPKKVCELVDAVCTDSTLKDCLLRSLPLSYEADRVDVLTLECSNKNSQLFNLAGYFPPQKGERSYRILLRELPYPDYPLVEKPQRLFIGKDPEEMIRLATRNIDEPDEFSLKGPILVSEKFVRFLIRFGIALRQNHEVMSSSIK